jgi:uncharacterized SAM-binding protein YcdF (DUF218 family)
MKERIPSVLNPIKRRALRIVLWTMAALLVLGLCWAFYVQWRIYTVKAEPLPAKADVGIVLGASIWGDRPSPGLAERLNLAIKLYREGRFTNIIVSGGMDAEGAVVTEAEGMRRYLQAAAVPEQAIVLEDKATSTYENMLFSKRIMQVKGWKSALIVTHTYHGARALEIAEFVDVPVPHVAVTDSTVLFMPWHQARETLAFAKWKIDELFLSWR